MSNLLRKIERHSILGIWSPDSRKLMKSKKSWGRAGNTGSGRSTDERQTKMYLRKKIQKQSRKINRRTR